MSASAASAAAIAVAMLALWLVSLVKRDVSIVDIFWGPGFAIVAWTSLAVDGHASPARVLLAALTTLWGGRLR